MMRSGAAVFALVAGLLAASAGAGAIAAGATDDSVDCAARTAHAGGASLRWIEGPADDRESLAKWCRAVGPPIFVAQPSPPRRNSLPSLDQLVVVTWNAHLAEGSLHELVAALRRGDLTDGQPVTHFVLLLQELFRRGSDVPRFGDEGRTAYAIRARDQDAPDARQWAAALGLSMLYVPSMRNGADLFEDRGNAILSTAPLLAPLALELPLERQRRVAIGAGVGVRHQGQPGVMRFIDAHLEPLSSPKSLWVFRNPRRRQVASILDLLRASRWEEQPDWAGTVLGGDFNTVQGGTDDDAYTQARAWATSLAQEDDRRTHRMGRIDYLFARLPAGWHAHTLRIEEKFGSDHHPVMARFTRSAVRP